MSARARGAPSAAQALVAACLLLFGRAPAAAQTAANDDGAATVLVLDTGTRSVTVLDTGSGKTIGSVPIQGEPNRLLRTDSEGARFAVLDQGPGKLSARFGYHPSGKSVVTLIDLASVKATARIELGWGLGPALATPDGRYLVVLCPGYESKNRAETLARELVTVDLTSGQVAGRVALDRPVDRLLLTREGDVALAFSPRVDSKKPAEVRPAELKFIDVKTSSVITSLKLDGVPGGATLSPDGAYVYLLDVGKPSKKPEKNIKGRLHIVSLANRSVERTLDAGSGPRGLIVDDVDRQVLILSDGPPSKEKNQTTGELRVIKGADLAATVKVADDPHFLRIAPNRARVYVIGGKALTAVDYSSFHADGDMPLETAGAGWLAPGLHVSEMVITDDGTRAFALYPRSSKLLVLDLESRKPVAAVTTGRGGVKFGKLMAAAAMTAASSYAGASMASAMGSPYYTYQVYGVSPASTELVLRPDGQFAYVLNSQTNDVTIVKSDGTVVDKLGGGGRRLQLMGGGHVVTAVGSSLHLIDTAEHKAQPEPVLGGSVVDLVLSRDRRYAVALLQNGVVCLDGFTGAVVAKGEGFKRPTQVMFVRQHADETPEKE